MTIKEFIEAAIEGGWKNKELPTMITEDKIYGDIITAMYWRKMFPTIALDPEAWKAVGKVKGHKSISDIGLSWYENSMHDMIDWLILGKTLEEFIATL